MSVGQWLDVVDQLVALGVERIHICGGEPLLVPWLPSFFEKIWRLRAKHDFLCGLVTNGILLPERLHWFAHSPVDYVDVSLDGLRDGHEHLRGIGTFDRTLAAIGRASRALGADRVHIATVVYPGNVAEIPGMIDLLHGDGLRYFFLQPVRAMGRAKLDDSLVIAPNALLGLVNRLISRRGRAKARIEVYIDYEFKDFFYRHSKPFRQVCKRVARGRVIGFRIPMGELHLSLNWECEAFRGTCMIGPAGEMFGCCYQAAHETGVGPRAGFVTEKSVMALLRRGQRQDWPNWTTRLAANQDGKQDAKSAGVPECPLDMTVVCQPRS